MQTNVCKICGGISPPQRLSAAKNVKTCSTACQTDLAARNKNGGEARRKAANERRIIKHSVSLMTAANELKTARESCCLSLADWAIALGYRSSDRKNLRQQVCDMEGGRKPITPQVARLAEMFRRHGVPKEWLQPLE